MCLCREKWIVPFRCGWSLSAGRSMSLLVPAGSHLPDYPQESTTLRFTALLDV
ncbi:hypothetical protein [Rossellomorea marisflavi]|uniref:hypothetical protein n=1 Tax=Rossellomorea marisflavi TaxID=189381 RepID=UPI00356AADC7